MWDLKLFLIDSLYTLNAIFFDTLSNFINIIDPVTFSGSSFFNWKSLYHFSQNVTFFFGIKFILAIAFLILIRGGTPRYRYDYLTKLGWLKFLGFIILVFLFALFVFFIF